MEVRLFGVGIGPARLDQEDQIVSTCLTTLPAFGRQALESKRVRLDFRRRLDFCLSVPVITPARRVSASTFFRISLASALMSSILVGSGPCSFEGATFEQAPVLRQSVSRLRSDTKNGRSSSVAQR